MGEAPRAKAPELRGRAGALAISLVLVALVGGSWWGWSYGGPTGGLLGVLLGAAVGTLGFTIVYAVASGRQLEDAPAPDVRELPPDQAMRVLTALMQANASNAEAKLELQGGLLGEIAKASARAKRGDLDGALAKLRALAEEHPRAPAVPREITRVLAGRQDHAEERRRASGAAISLAIHGGMNRLAADVYQELEEAERAQLELDGEVWDRLGKAFAARGDTPTAASCRARGLTC